MATSKHKFHRQAAEYTAHAARLEKYERELKPYLKRSSMSGDQDRRRFLEAKVRRMRAQIYLN